MIHTVEMRKISVANIFYIKQEHVVCIISIGRFVLQFSTEVKFKFCNMHICANYNENKIKLNIYL